MKYDVVVPLLKTDLPTLLKNISYLKDNLPCKRIVIIGKEDLRNEIKSDSMLYFVDEDTLFDGLTFNKIKQIKTDISGNGCRSGWYFQQFLKMAYANVCIDDYYLIWDADTIPVRKIDFFDSEGKPFLDYIDYKSYDECYTPAQLALLPNNQLEKKEHKSFIAEHMLVNVKIMKQLIEDLTFNSSAGKKTFYENIMYSIPSNLINLSGFSEFECYAAYLLNKFPFSHTMRKWKNLRNGRVYIGDEVSKDNLLWISKVFDVVSLEECDSKWFLCTIIKKIKPSICFQDMYNIINPIYNKYYTVRMLLRSLIKS